MILPKIIKSFVSDSIIYTLLNLMNKAIPFLLLPFVIRMVSPKDFGFYSLFITVETLLIPIVSMNMPAALSSHYYNSTINLKKYLSTIVWGMMAAVLFFCIIIVMFPKGVLLESGLEFNYIIVCIFTAGAMGLINMVSNLYRLQRKPWLYGIFSISQSLLLLLIVILFCSLSPSFFMLTAGRVIYIISFAIISFVLLYRSNLLSLDFDKDWFKRIIKFSIPTVFYSISAFIFLSSDRFLIKHFCGILEVGYYSAIFQLASLISILGMSLNASWMPWLFENLKKDNYEIKVFIVKLSYFLIGIFMVIGILFCFSYPYIAKMILPTNYHPYIETAFPIILGFVFEAIYLIVSPYTFYVEKTKYNGFIGITIAIFNVLLNIYLIPKIGIMGAAYSTLFSWVSLSILFFIFSYRIYPMPWFTAFKKNN